jgi:hypothetical protein
MHSDWKDDSAHAAADTFAPGARVAVLATASVDGGSAVFTGEPSGEPIGARSTISLSEADVGRSVLVVFENGDAQRPIIIGVLQESPVVAAHGAQSNARVLHDIQIDGKRITLVAEQEVSLRCGDASITLRADGRVVIKGMEIVSRARGVNKLKGASVLIN